MRRASIACAAAFVVGLMTLAMPFARAAGQTTAAPTTEAWYQPNPSCPGPAGCVTPTAAPTALPANPSTSPFPAGTLHVGFAAAQETARTYLAFSVPTLERVTSALLTVPLDTTAGNGSISPETAKVQVCRYSGGLAPADGSIDEPPETDCSATAPAVYRATPTPHLQADVTKVVGGSGLVSGVALLPDATTVGPTDSWRVVFSAHTRADAAKTAPASITFAIADADPDVDEPVPGVVDLPSEDAPFFGNIVPAEGIAFASVPSVPAATPAAVADTPIGSIATVGQQRTVTVPYAYPAVWLLPLGLLVLVPAIAIGLTKDLAPPTPGE
jgi:hypothetical protein